MQNFEKILTSQEKFKINLGLERIEKILELFDNPQEKLKVLHIAGTNGKGSTATMLNNILIKNDFKCGLYTSPHILSYTERFKINNIDISEEKLNSILNLVNTKAKENNIDLTEFELLTAIGFIYFYEENVDFAIMETGLGGRFDATNIIKHPICSIITSISKDHTDRLGDTLEKIAFEKAGIIKENSPVIISESNSGRLVIENIAKEKNAPIYLAENFELKNPKTNEFTNGKESYKLSLLGIHQGENLGLVIKAVDVLKKNFDINNIEKGLLNSFIPCRMQYFKEYNILFDGAHNESASKLLKENLDLYFIDREKMFIFGVLARKDYKSIIKNLFNDNDKICIDDDFETTAIKKEVLKEEISAHCKNITYIDNAEKLIKERLNNTKEKNQKLPLLIITGSFYLCAKYISKCKY